MALIQPLTQLCLDSSVPAVNIWLNRSKRPEEMTVLPISSAVRPSSARAQFPCSRLQGAFVTASGPGRPSGPLVGHCSRLQRISTPVQVGLPVSVEKEKGSVCY